MAVISPSAASGGRNTGFSYVFNASRAVFQDNVKNASAKNVTHKSKGGGSEINKNESATAEKCKDSVTNLVHREEDEFAVIAVKTSRVDPIVESKDKTKSVYALNYNVGLSTVTSRTNKENSQCVNKSEDSANPEKSSSKNRLAALTNVKNVKENVNVSTDDVLSNPTANLNVTMDQIIESVSTKKTPVSKNEKSQPEHGQTVTDKTSKYQLGFDKLGKKDHKKSPKDHTDEYLVKCKADIASSCATNIQKFEEKTKKESLQVSSNKNSSKKYPKDEKIDRNANETSQQKGIEQNDNNNSLTKNAQKSNERENVGNFENKCTTEKSDVKSPTKTNSFIGSKKNLISNPTNKCEAENLQTGKNATSDKSGTKSQKESTDISPEKFQDSDVKVHLVEQAISKSKKNVIKPHTESSEKLSNKCNKESKDSTSIFSLEKVQKSNLKNETSGKPVVKSRKETTISTSNKISVKKDLTDNKDIEKCEKTVAKSQISTKEISVEKFQKDSIKTEVGSPRQLIKSQKDTSQSFTGTISTTTPQECKEKESTEKPLVSQKNIIQTSTEKFLIEKFKENDLKTEKSLKSQKALQPVSTDQIAKNLIKEDTKHDTDKPTVAKSEKDTSHFAHRFSPHKSQGNNLRSENSIKSSQQSIMQFNTGSISGSKVRTDDTKKIEATKSDSDYEKNIQICPSKISVEKHKFDKIKGEKPVIKSQKGDTENLTEKSSRDSLKDKHNEKQIAKIHKDMQNNMNRITSEKPKIDNLKDNRKKTQTDKLKDKTIDKDATKAPKEVLSSTSNVLARKQGDSKINIKDSPTNQNNDKLCADRMKGYSGKKTFFKDNDDNTASKNPVVTSPKDNIEKLSSANKITGAKISAVKSQKDILKSDTVQTCTIRTISNKETISADTTKTNINDNISENKDQVDKNSHQVTDIKTSQTVVEKCPTTFQIDKKISSNSKVSVSRLSGQEYKKHNAHTDEKASTPSTVHDDMFKDATKSIDISQKFSNATHLKMESDKIKKCTDKPSTGMSQTKSVQNTFSNTQKQDASETSTEDSLAKQNKLSKVYNSEADGKSLGVPKLNVDSEEKVHKMNSLDNKHSVICDFSTEDISDKYKNIILQDTITHPNILISNISPSSADAININKTSKAEVQTNCAVHRNLSQEQNSKTRRYTKENRPCSYPSTEYQNFDGLQQRSSSQQSLDYYTRDCTLSAVDYAKSRFQNVQQTPRCDEIVKPKPKHTQVVNEFKSLWENYEQKETEGFNIPHPKMRKSYVRKKLSSLSPDGQCDADFPIRPFLTKGSVAERVLLFECCPERALDRSSGKSKSLLYNTWKSAGLHHKTRFWEVIGEKDRPPRSSYIQRDRENFELSKAAAFCRFSKSSNVNDIPLFHYPQGRPLIQTEIEKQLKEIKTVFSAFTDEKVTKEEFGIITKACNLPLYWKFPLFLSAAGENKPFLKCDVFLQYWKRIISVYHDEASQFVAVLTKCSRNYLLPDDFISMIQDIIDTHPGLTFLKEATEFHSRYVHTVISRIYYCVNKSWSGKITVAELRKSNFLQIVSLLEKEDDINQITDYFSYEHFYVIYCKFWELDKDHDLFIDKNDLQKHNDGAISSRMIERIFSGAVTRAPVHKDGKMSYTDFVWFLFSEEDKRHPRSIEYWFRCMDLDGDGYLSMYEMEYFYEEQLQRMEALNIETLPFKDCLCQMLDMIRPRIPGLISLADLKKCKMTPLFFDTFFNLEKYLDHEQRDPFASQREQDTDNGDISDWDRYASEEYELLVADEGTGEQSDDLIYEDYTQEDDELLSNSQKISGSSIINRSSSAKDATDEDYVDSELTYY